VKEIIVLSFYDPIHEKKDTGNRGSNRLFLKRNVKIALFFWK